MAENIRADSCEGMLRKGERRGFLPEKVGSGLAKRRKI